MLNKSGVTKTGYTNVNQILANVELQASVGCIVPQTMGTEVGTKKIAKAGTPLHLNFENLATAAEAVASSKPMNAVLLHDVDVTAGNANATGLIFGFVNLNRVDSAVVSAITAAKAVEGCTGQITFLKM